MLGLSRRGRRDRAASRRISARRRALKPWMDGLEDRVVLSVAVPPAIVWTGGAGDGLWNTPGNWDGDAVPTASDDVRISGTATVTVNTDAEVNNLTTDIGVTLVFDAGMGITGDGTFTNHGIISKPESGGASNIGIRVDNQGSILVGAGSTLGLTGGLENYVSQGMTRSLTGGVYEVSGTLIVPGAIWSLEGDADVALIGDAPHIIVTPGATLSALNRLSLIDVGASLTIQGNTLNNKADSGLTNNGSLTIVAGGLHVDENFTQTNNGSLTIGIAGPDQGAGGYGYLDVNVGEATLAGALNATLLNDYVPGDATFSIIGSQKTSNVVSGTFGSFTALNPPPSIRMSVAYNEAKSVDLVIHELTSITVSPGSATIAKGETQAFTADGTYSDGTTVENLDGVSWSSDDDDLASVDSEGLATGRGVGVATITAAVGDVSGSATLIVDPARLLSLSVSPVDTTIAKGETATFIATAEYTDGQRIVTSEATWSSSDDSIAEIIAAGQAKGVGVSVDGPVTITASLDGKNATAELTVTEAELVSLTISTHSASIAKGETATFIATAEYTDGQRIVTSEAAWSSSDDSIAEIIAAGQAKGVGVSVDGPVTITAKLGDETATAELTVTDAKLLSFTITPTETLLYLGQTQQFKATGTFTDGERDATDLVTWISSNTTVATIGENDGKATALAAGQTTISATYGDLAPVLAELNVAIQAQVEATSVSWGSMTAPLATHYDGFRLLPSGRDFGETIGWAGINRINITLDRDADLTPGDITVSSLANINYGAITLSGSGKNWVIHLENAINVADRVTFSINNLGVEFFERRLDVLPGDVNGDGVVSLQDVIYVRNGVQSFEPILLPIYFLDVVGDGGSKPGMNSLTAVLTRFGTKLPSLA